MKLPDLPSLQLEWQAGSLENWTLITQDVQRLRKSAGKGDLFQKVMQQLLQMLRAGDCSPLPELLRERVTERALTQLWLENAEFRQHIMKKQLLQYMVSAQRPLLGIIALHNLVTLYFTEYDRLDQCEEGLRETLENIIKAQIQLRFEKKYGSVDNRDLLAILYREAPWLLSADGPRKLVDYTRRENRDLSEVFLTFELRGLDDGRYGDICRALYYLDTLRTIPVGAYDEVFAELLNPSVSKAPYEGQKRIGHAALEILIDRAEDDPGEHWQNFIMDLAGDPRIASSAASYREWWKPLGEERIEKVRSWLAKEDLRLFLRALEQYSKESGKEEIRRMFPARKKFLEGLERMKLVRSTRLMLGSEAAISVKKILGNDLKTNYIRLTNENGMSDKAVIYVNCGDFCLVEGTHNFKLWVYLAPPSELAYSYDVKKLSHSELTLTVRSEYIKKYGASASYIDITHYPNVTWQNKFFVFLADHGISLDIEQFLTAEDYNELIKRFGIPVVNRKKTVLKQRVRIEALV
ncbi:EH signature domain-containing protein [Microbulbifer thermotolerans]|uniref:EH signature domain-containing protein n=1 Tax=Microbulbifer thermotolerans TaxID=252514 RepID=UPI00224961DB|nr:EH signature domain-containing protein [Microbulbifer thermotolerans]MCX2779244.1 EH signature domain-containing protein [Microbulbifer thermotolerans]MCX2803668.1 EH signature domain-containing protein [Microbulbifer thermotolerans]MCX2830431.1 EH signature domain-containing protein [Microbulbifer thermotolerans]